MSRMEVNIKGNPGSGNCYDDIHINKVDTYIPNARTVVNNQGTTVNINFTISINLDKQQHFNLFRNVQVFLLGYLLLLQEALHSLFSHCLPCFMRNSWLEKAMAKVSQILVQKRNRLRWAMKPASSPIEAHCVGHRSRLHKTTIRITL